MKFYCRARAQEQYVVVAMAETAATTVAAGFWGAHEWLTGAEDTRVDNELRIIYMEGIMAEEERVRIYALLTRKVLWRRRSG
jgi:hypothetical protein